MTDDDWLKFDNVNGADTNANEVFNPIQSNQQIDQNQEVQISYNDENNGNIDGNVASSVGSKKGCLTRRRLCVGLVVVISIIGAAIGISLTELSRSSKKGTVDGVVKGGKNKLENYGKRARD